MAEEPDSPQANLMNQCTDAGVDYSDARRAEQSGFEPHHVGGESTTGHPIAAAMTARRHQRPKIRPNRIRVGIMSSPHTFCERTQPSLLGTIFWDGNRADPWVRLPEPEAPHAKITAGRDSTGCVRLGAVRIVRVPRLRLLLAPRFDAVHGLSVRTGARLSV